MPNRKQAEELRNQNEAPDWLHRHSKNRPRDNKQLHKLEKHGSTDRQYYTTIRF